MTRHFFMTFALGCLWLSGCQDDIRTEPDASAWRVSSDMNTPGDMHTLEDIPDVPIPGDASTPEEDMGEADTDLSCPEVPRGLCRTQDAVAWAGECEDTIGAFFDGTRCHQAVGCPCEPPGDCPAFDSMEACTTACGKAGMCNADVLPWITSDTLEACTIRTCTEGIAVCVQGDEDPTERVNRKLAASRDFFCQPPAPNSICEFGLALDCSQSWCCTSQPDDGIEERPQLEQLCGLSLFPDVLGVTCIRLE